MMDAQHESQQHHEQKSAWTAMPPEAQDSQDCGRREGKLSNQRVSASAEEGERSVTTVELAHRHQIQTRYQ